MYSIFFILIMRLDALYTSYKKILEYKSANRTGTILFKGECGEWSAKYQKVRWSNINQKIEETNLFAVKEWLF